MKTRRYWLIFALIILVLLGLGAISRWWMTSQEVPNGVSVNMASDYRLGETFEDDLVVMAGTIALEPESRVLGDASLIGETVIVNGTVDGDLTILGDHLTLSPQSQINGDVSLIGSDITLGGRVTGDIRITGDSLTVLPEAQIAGTMNPCATSISDNRVDVQALTPCESRPFPVFNALLALRQPAIPTTQVATPTSVLITLVLGALSLAGLSTLAVTLFPRQISRIEEAIRLRPRGLGGAGFAVFLLVLGMSAALIVLLAILPPVGLLLLPIYALAGVVLLGLVIAGLIPLSLVLGDWLVHRVARIPAPPLVTAAIGSLVLSTLLTLLALVPFGSIIGLVILLVVSSVGVGAALFTRMGTRPLQRSYFVQG